MDQYWFVVALSYGRDEAFVVAMSDAAAEISTEADFIYEHGDEWVQPEFNPGLYRLTISFPVDEDGTVDIDANMKIDNVELLLEFPPLPEKEG